MLLMFVSRIWPSAGLILRVPSSFCVDSHGDNFARFCINPFGEDVKSQKYILFSASVHVSRSEVNCSISICGGRSMVVCAYVRTHRSIRGCAIVYMNVRFRVCEWGGGGGEGRGSVVCWGSSSVLPFPVSSKQFSWRRICTCSGHQFIMHTWYLKPKKIKTMQCHCRFE